MYGETSWRHLPARKREPLPRTVLSEAKREQTREKEQEKGKEKEKEKAKSKGKGKSRARSRGESSSEESMVRLLSRLVLQQQEQLSATLRSTSMVVHLGRESHGIVSSMLAASKKWKDCMMEDSSKIKEPLRLVMFKVLMTSLLQRHMRLLSGSDTSAASVNALNAERCYYEQVWDPEQELPRSTPANCWRTCDDTGGLQQASRRSVQTHLCWLNRASESTSPFGLASGDIYASNLDHAISSNQRGHENVAGYETIDSSLLLGTHQRNYEGGEGETPTPCRAAATQEALCRLALGRLALANHVLEPVSDAQALDDCEAVVDDAPGRYDGVAGMSITETNESDKPG